VGFWSLVVEPGWAELVGFVVLARVAPCKPWQLRWNFRALRDLIPVALPVAGASLLSVAARRMDTVVLALFLPNRAVGIYFFVYRLVFAAQMVTQHGMSEVAMVVLSSLNKEAERYRSALLRAMRLMSFVCACAFGLLAVAGPWVVPWVFSNTWAPATEPLRVMAALSVGGAVVSVAGVTLVASGYAAAYSRLVVGSALAQLLAVALTARWGLVAVAWGVGIAQCLSMIPALRMLSKHYALPVMRLAQQVVPTLLLFALGMGVALWLGRMGSAWYVQPRAVLGFVLVMGVGALLLLRKEREIIARESIAAPPPAAPPN
jgi:O-antigen/teichoic acid export membrane protein